MSNLHINRRKYLKDLRNIGKDIHTSKVSDKVSPTKKDYTKIEKYLGYPGTKKEYVERCGRTSRIELSLKTKSLKHYEISAPLDWKNSDFHFKPFKTA